MFSIRLEIPALQSLMDYLVGREQAQIDNLTAAVVSATAKLKTATDALSVKEK